MTIKAGQRYVCNTDEISGLVDGTIVEVGAVADDGTVIVITHAPTQTINDDMVMSTRYQPISMAVDAKVFDKGFAATKKKIPTVVGEVVPDA